jgi:hypothetical protein
VGSYLVDTGRSRWPVTYGQLNERGIDVGKLADQPSSKMEYERKYAEIKKKKKKVYYNSGS